jgi:hypothetical protein
MHLFAQGFFAAFGSGFGFEEFGRLDEAVPDFN